MKQFKMVVSLLGAISLFFAISGLTASGNLQTTREASFAAGPDSLNLNMGLDLPQIAVISQASHDFVSVIDLETNRLVDTIHVGSGPGWTAKVPGKDEFYVANFRSNNVAIIEGSNETRCTTVPAGLHPVCVAFTPDGNIALISHQSQDGLWFMNTKTHKITAKISEGTGYVYYLKNTEKFYQPAIFRPFIHIIDPAKEKIVKSVWVGGRPMALAFTPDGKYAYIPNYDLDEVQVLSTTLDSVVKVIPDIGNPRGIAITPDCRYALVTDVTSNTVTVIGIDSNSVVKAIPVDKMPTDVAITPDGKFAYVTNQGSGSLSVIDLANLDVVAHIEVPDNPITIFIPNQRSK